MNLYIILVYVRHLPIFFVMVSIISKFDWLSEYYTKYRPFYSEDSINYILKTAKNNVEYIADIWAWTWKLTEQFLNKWKVVYAVEPNHEMLNQLITKLWNAENFRYIQSTAEKISLPDYSIDLVAVGQAFHWFDTKLFKKECKRILNKTWRVAILYNNWDKNSEIIKVIDELSKKYCPLYKWSSWWLDNKESVFKEFFSEYETLMFPNDYTLTLEAFLWLNFSASYAPKQWDKNYLTYKENLETIFNKYALWGLITMNNNTVLRLWVI